MFGRLASVTETLVTAMYNLRRFVLIVSVLLVVMTSSTVAQGQPKSTGAQSEIRSFKITNRDEDAERYNFEVEYTYSGERGKTVYISAFPLFRDRKRAPDIVCGQGEVEAGSGNVSGTIWSKWSAYPATVYANACVFQFLLRRK